MAIVIDPKYNIKDIVYLITDPEQLPRIVYSYIVYQNEILYRVLTGTITSDHYDFELSLEKHTLINA